jgi:bacterioferritin-associated ferredoxin
MEMYVCVCLAVKDSEVEGAISKGAHTREAVTRACKAGGDCGACHGMIEQMIENHLEDQLIAAESLVRTRAA